MNMKQWIDAYRTGPVKKALPILSFPCVQLLGVGVKELIMDSGLQARGMKLVADRVDSAAAVSMMDLSVEAEAFGSAIRVADDEVPTVIGHIIETQEEADALRTPKAGEGRTGLYVEAIGKACGLITDRPVLAGVIGPFSLAGRLMGVSEAMIYCYDEPDMVHTVLDKAAAFLTEYVKAYKAAGAGGVVMAEPLAGLLSPALNAEFSVPYVRRVAQAVQDDDFVLIYHNCGNETIRLIGDILTIGAAGYHFGNAIDMAEMMRHIPPDVLALGNVDPAGALRGGTPDSVRAATLQVMAACRPYPNHAISSGCDIPPMTPWENIDAFFAAVREFYANAAVHGY